MQFPNSAISSQPAIQRYSKPPSCQRLTATSSSRLIGKACTYQLPPDLVTVVVFPRLHQMIFTRISSSSDGGSSPGRDVGLVEGGTSLVGGGASTSKGRTPANGSTSSSKMLALEKKMTSLEKTGDNSVKRPIVSKDLGSSSKAVHSICNRVRKKPE